MLKLVKLNILSDELARFVTTYHSDSAGFTNEWGYNKLGFHPLHSLVLAMRDPEFPVYIEFKRSTEKAAAIAKDEYLWSLWQEAVKVTTSEYGTPGPYTQRSQPPTIRL